MQYFHFIYDWKKKKWHPKCNRVSNHYHPFPFCPFLPIALPSQIKLWGQNGEKLERNLFDVLERDGKGQNGYWDESVPLRMANGVMGPKGRYIGIILAFTGYWESLEYGESGKGGRDLQGIRGFLSISEPYSETSLTNLHYLQKTLINVNTLLRALWSFQWQIKMTFFIINTLGNTANHLFNL